MNTSLPLRRAVQGVMVPLFLYACSGDNTALFMQERSTSGATKPLVTKISTHTSSASRYGFKPKPIEGDGNCLFRAVADQLQEAPFNVRFPATQDHHSIIRQIAVEHVKSNPDTYQNYFPNEVFTSVEDWLTKICRNGEWGGQMAIRVLSD
ncbi:MAG: OTU domain-containing protein, partial [Bacteroidota bacterium]